MQRDHTARSPFAILFQETEVIATRARIAGLDFGPMSGRGHVIGSPRAECIAA
jgi:hypothetical protein